MDNSLESIAKSLKIGHYSRHVLLCIGPSCCSDHAGNAAWKKLKDLLKELNLSLSTGPTACYRTKVQCLRVCKDGPILVVYPDGFWYHGMTEDRIERFVHEQIVQGKPIQEWIFAQNPLPNDTPPKFVNPNSDA